MNRMTVWFLVGAAFICGCADDHTSKAPTGTLSRDEILARFAEPDTIHFALPDRAADGSSVETRTTELDTWPCRSFIWDMGDFQLQIAQIRFPEETRLTGEPADGLKAVTAFIADDPNLSVLWNRADEINGIPAHVWVIEWREQEQYELRTAVMGFPYVYVVSIFAGQQDVFHSNPDVVAFLQSIARPDP